MMSQLATAIDESTATICLWLAGCLPIEEVSAVVSGIHQSAGYLMAFLIAPLILVMALLRRSHGPWGKSYFWLMTFVYATGLFFTVTKYPWDSYQFCANLLVNFFGYSMVLYAYRSSYLLNRFEDPGPMALDWGLLILLAGCVVAFASLAWWMPSRTVVHATFAGVGSVLLFMDIACIRRRFRPRLTLYRRHVRYVLASNYYVFTVLSVVHMGHILNGTVKWLWPTVLASAVVPLMTTNIGSAVGLRVATVTKAGIIFTLCIGAAFGAYLLAPELRGPSGGGPEGM